MKFLIVLLLGAFCSPLVLAQGWVSSGGELFRDAKNPWFVRNTSIVKYCIQVEKTNFSADPRDISTAVQEGFEYWKAEFSRTMDMGDGTFQLATQNFVEGACSEETDIRFLFGFQTLASAEIEYLKNPAKYIGVTVRTAYDFKNLKAKGFIYFSSDHGPNAYDNNGTLVEKAWSHPRLLKYAILHELGHVFGIPHMGSGLMSEVFLNQILNKKLVDKYEKSPIESFFRPSEEIESCSISGPAMAWFGGPSGYRCLVVQAPNMLMNWKVFAKKDESSAPEEIGELRNLTHNMFDRRGRAATILEITEDQKVFTPKETGFRTFMMGPLILDMGLSGTYISKKTKRPQPSYISITSSSLSIQGMVTPSKLEPVFLFNSPLSLLLLMPPNL